MYITKAGLSVSIFFIISCFNLPQKMNVYKTPIRTIPYVCYNV